MLFDLHYWFIKIFNISYRNPVDFVFLNTLLALLKMTTLITKPWNYTLSIDVSNTYTLSVLCGTVGMYEVEVILSNNQVKDYKQRGESAIDELAEAIRVNPNQYHKK